jgi:hypothetical protein
MNDPHVDWLRYRLKVNPRYVDFVNPPPLVQEYDAFDIRLDGEILQVEMKEHHASLESAKQRVEVFLKDWTVHATIDLDRDALEFEYEHAYIIDRNPPPEGSGIVTGQLYATVGVEMRATWAVLPPKRNEYPTPPSRFRASPDVETMWFRYQQHIEGRESYQSMGYFCLSFMQWSTGFGKGARKEASRIYKIDRDVLDTLGELTSEKGTPRDARKLESGATLIPLTDAEQRWIRAAVKMLIRRKGEYDYDPSTAASLKQITMADLPKL